MKRKKFLITLLTATLLLVSCGPATSNESSGAAESQVQETVKESAAESQVQETVKESAAEKEQETISQEAAEIASLEVVSSEIASSEVASSEASAPEEPKEYPPRITLSGNHDDHVITDKLCYVEGEKYFLLLDKDVDLPGDFGDNVELIIDEIENVTGFTFSIPAKLFTCDNSTVTFGYNPWDGFDFGMKVPIYLYPDRDSTGYISSASSEFMNLQLYELYSMDLWNSVPAYRDNPWRRDDHVNYDTVAHELTHVLTCRRAALTKIMTEGSADYVAEKVIKKLADVTGQYDFVESAARMDLSYHVKNEVTAENAEAVFRNDYSDLSQMERGDEYTLGRMMCLFLEENYGESSLHDYIAAVANAGYAYPKFIGDPNQNDINKMADLMKTTFGDDVFTKFGAWYQTHKDQ
ncbi:MAG: hypothetical protein IK081_03160 [Lachnospiraceae bacterium]|nr:hypothetical protein [Lachnospiraceae bacterium]